jgi:tripartite-type tricarboxylate transporter receptor subunit TctC
VRSAIDVPQMMAKHARKRAKSGEGSMRGRAVKLQIAGAFMLAALFAAAVAPSAPAAAQDAIAAFYKGRTVELVVGTLPGGGYDLYGRLVARYLGKHLPGNPTVIVKNMPGAGHLRMINWMYNAAPRDGSVIGTAPQALAIEQALGTDGIAYDAGKFTYIGRAAPVVEVTYTWHTSKTKTLADARTRETVMGGSGKASPTVFYLKALNALAGTRFKIVAGFRGVSETELAVQRGEVEGGTKAWASMKVDNAHWLRDRQVNIILQYALERAPDLPDVPMMSELGLDARASEALKLFAVGNAMGRSILAPPGVPGERAAALRKAFMAMMADAELLAFVKERRIDLGPALSGEALAKLVAETLAVSRETAAAVKKARGD